MDTSDHVRQIRKNGYTIMESVLSGANNLDKPRLAITPQYCQPWLRQLETMVLAVPLDQAAQYSDRVQALLGYSVRAPGFMGFVDGVHPKWLIDSSYRGRKARGIRS